MAEQSNSRYGIESADTPILLDGDGCVLENRLVQKRGDCCGCTACYSSCPVSAISMVPDVEGFLYPLIDMGLCVDCGLCERSCSYKARATTYPKTAPQCHHRCYIAKHNDEQIRIASSSGGVFWSFVEAVIHDGGIVYGCAFNDKLEAHHIRCSTLEEAAQCRGSKYMQSYIDDCFSSVHSDLKSDKTVLFTGTPCQNDGLRSYLLNCKAKIDRLICVDIICHGVPSQRLFAEHLSFIEGERKSKVVGYWHRPKDHGWRHEEKFSLENGKSEMGTTLSTVWKKLFYSNLALRCSCYVCPYTDLNRPSDITIGDFWGISDRYPDYMDATGVSVILVNTQTGLAFLNAVQTLTLKECSIDDVLPRNPMLERPSVLTRPRDAFWKTYTSKGYPSLVREYGWYSMTRRIKNAIKRLVRK